MRNKVGISSISPNIVSAYLYVMNAKAKATNDIELPSTTPKATIPSLLLSGLSNESIDEERFKGAA